MATHNLTVNHQGQELTFQLTLCGETLTRVCYTSSKYPAQKHFLDPNRVFCCTQLPNFREQGPISYGTLLNQSQGFPLTREGLRFKIIEEYPDPLADASNRIVEVSALLLAHPSYHAIKKKV